MQRRKKIWDKKFGTYLDPIIDPSSAQINQLARVISQNYFQGFHVLLTKNIWPTNILSTRTAWKITLTDPMTMSSICRPNIVILCRLNAC
jgi:hypothetical protein